MAQVQERLAAKGCTGRAALNALLEMLQQPDVGTKFGGSTGGGNSNFNLSTIGQSLDSFARAEITLEVVSTNAATASVTGTIVFLADDGTVLATQGMGTAPVGGALAPALADPAIGVAVGFTHADAAAAPGFIAQLDSLTITEGDGSVPSVDTDAPTAAITLTNSKGVTLALSGKQLGLDASLDLSGMRITLQ